MLRFAESTIIAALFTLGIMLTSQLGIEPATSVQAAPENIDFYAHSVRGPH